MKELVKAGLAAIEPHVTKYPEGKWHYRTARTAAKPGWVWIECDVEPNPSRIGLRYKRGKNYVHVSADGMTEYSYRVINTTSTETYEETFEETNMNLFDDIHDMLDFTQATKVAEVQHEKGKMDTIVYADPVKGVGMLTVSGIGIINRCATPTDIYRAIK